MVFLLEQCVVSSEHCRKLLPQESVGYSDDVSQINKIVDEDVNKVIKAIEAIEG